MLPKGRHRKDLPDRCETGVGGSAPARSCRLPANPAEKSRASVVPSDVKLTLEGRVTLTPWKTIVTVVGSAMTTACASAWDVRDGRGTAELTFGGSNGARAQPCLGLEDKLRGKFPQESVDVTSFQSSAALPGSRFCEFLKLTILPLCWLDNKIYQTALCCAYFALGELVLHMYAGLGPLGAGIAARTDAPANLVVAAHEEFSDQPTWPLLSGGVLLPRACLFCVCVVDLFGSINHT